MHSDLRQYTHLGDGAAVVRVVGEVGVRRAAGLRAVLAGRVDHGRILLIVDMEQTARLDTTALGVLVSCRKRVRAQGGELLVVTRQEGVLRQFRRTGLTRVLPVRATLAQAVAELALIRPGLLPRPLDADGESVQVP